MLFVRTWKNSLLFLEEDLAVGLMWKLLFVPLFHDASIVGRALSFMFRLVRILIGLSAMGLMSLAILGIAVYWFLLPVLVFFLNIAGFISQDFWDAGLSFINISSEILLFSGVVLFIHHIIGHPEKKLWNIKKIEDIWKCSFVKKKEIAWEKLLQKHEVKNFLLYLEQTPDKFLNLVPLGKEEEVLQKVWDLGKKFKVPYLTPEYFFVAELLTAQNIENELLKIELSTEDFINVLDFNKKKQDYWRMVLIFDNDFQVRHLRGVNRGWLGVPTPNLDTVSDDLTLQASKELIPDFVGRQDIVKRVVDILSMEEGRNVVIVGEPGSGRGALVAYLAKLIISGNAPASLATKRLMGLDFTRLVSGIKTQGELAERIKDIFEEVEFSGNIIVYVDEIQNLGLGEASSEFNLYSLILPYIESSRFQFIGVTDQSSFSRIIEKNKSFVRLFTKIDLSPATVDETVDILKNQAIEHERYKKIKTSLIAIKSIAKLSGDYVHDLVLPDSALQVFKEALVSAEGGWIKKTVVEKVIQERTNIPVGEAGKETKTELLNLENTIHQKMVDQEEAVSDVAKTLRRAGAELRDKNRPIGSFLFVGPTGVGKTELAKTLADVYFKGQSKNFVRFDMSEYQTQEAADRLIGKTGEEGELTETARRGPYSLILLDEFEKAEPKILTLFLQILEDGRLTSGSGRTVDFTNTIIIATSNAASLTIAKGLEEGFSMDQIKDKVHDELLQIFKPELINRFDDVVLFKPLSKEHLKEIVKLKLGMLQTQLKDQGYTVEFDQSLVERLAEDGYDPVLGARPLRRLIQDTLEAKLSTLILEDKLPKGEKFIAGEQLLT